MRRALILTAITAIMLAACAPEHNKTQQKQLDGEISSLSARVAALSSQVAALQAQRTATLSGSWILWRRLALLHFQETGVIVGPAPARPWGAFHSKTACEEHAQQIAARHGAQGEATSYIARSSHETDRVFFTCLPQGVRINF